MIALCNTARLAASRRSLPVYAYLCVIFAMIVFMAAPVQMPSAYAQLLLPSGGGRDARLIPSPKMPVPPDKVMVKLAPGVSPAFLAMRYNAAVAAATPAALDGRVAAPQAVAPALTYLRSHAETGWHVLRFQGVTLEQILAELKQQPGVLQVQPDYRVKLMVSPPLAPPNDTYYGQQNWQDLVVVLSQLDTDKASAIVDDVAYWDYTWTLEIINALDAWNVFPGKYYTAADRTKKGVYLPMAGVIDTGIDFTHPDFSLTGNPNGSQFTYDYTDESTPDPNNVFAIATHDTDVKNGGQINIGLSRSFIDGEYPVDALGNPNYAAGDPKWAIDGFGHGTSVSGIIAAAANKGYGIPGLAYCAQILMMKAIDNSGSGTEDEIEQAMTYAANHGCLVVNMSLALDSTDYSQAMQDAVNYCWKKGTLVVAAAGNDNDSANPTLGATRRFPANCERVLAVAASAFATPGSDHSSPGTTLQGEQPASYSNFGPNIGVGAPGGDVTYFNDPTDTLTTIGEDPAPEYVLPFTLAPTYLAALSDPNNPEGVYNTLFLYGINPDGSVLHYGAIPGTSLATPHVVGLAALYGAKFYASLAAAHKKAVPPTPQQMINAIERGAANEGSRTDGGLSSPSAWGYGRIDAAATLNEQNARNATVGGIVGQVILGSTIQQNIRVTAQRSLRGRPVVGTRIYTATTGPDGVFRISNLPSTDKSPQTYYVSATYNYVGPNGRVLALIKFLPSVVVVPGCDQHGIDLVF
ncbi:MAG TPA: S8 family serine peptidase [Chthonomonadaceae bacterium]|nr:S8 family serine peptidase [Chthonomonadaceae bacterium]